MQLNRSQRRAAAKAKPGRVFNKSVAAMAFNTNQAREIDDLKFEIRELRERLAGRVYE